MCCLQALALHNVCALGHMKSLPENRSGPSATEAGFALPCTAQGTGWVLLRKVAETTVLVPLGSPCPVQHFVPEQHHWSVRVGLCREQGARKSLPGEQQPALQSCWHLCQQQHIASIVGFGTHCASHQCGHCCVKFQGKWHKAFTIMSVLAEE